LIRQKACVESFESNAALSIKKKLEEKQKGQKYGSKSAGTKGEERRGVSQFDLGTGRRERGKKRSGDQIIHQTFNARGKQQEGKKKERRVLRKNQEEIVGKASKQG